MSDHKHFFRFKRVNQFFSSEFLEFRCEGCGKFCEMRKSVFWTGFPPYKMLFVPIDARI